MYCLMRNTDILENLKSFDGENGKPLIAWWQYWLIAGCKSADVLSWYSMDQILKRSNGNENKKHKHK